MSAVRFLTVGVAAVVGFVSPSVGQDQCAQILRDGVFQRNSIESSASFKNAVRDYICSSTGSSSEKVRGLGLSIPIFEAAVGPTLGINLNQSNQSVSQSLNCQDHTKADSKQLAETIRKEFGDPTIVEAWRFCIAATADATANGLTCKLSVLDEKNPTVALLQLTWRPVGGNSPLKITSSSGDNLKCDSFDGSQLQPHTSLNRVCKRSDVKAAGFLAINSDLGQSCSPRVEAEKDPPPAKSCVEEINGRFSSVSRPIEHAAGLRCCQMKQTLALDTDTAKFAEKRIGDCKKLFEQNKGEMAKICLQSVGVVPAQLTEATLYQISLEAEARVKNAEAGEKAAPQCY